jgi:alpha-glucosidase
MTPKSQVMAERNPAYEVTSPDKLILLQVEIEEKIRWSVQYKEDVILAPSSISLQINNSAILGEHARVISCITEQVDTEFDAIHYRKSVVRDQYTLLAVQLEGDFGVEFRVYNDAVAYRFFTQKMSEIIVKNEEANFNFTGDHPAFIPYMWDYRDGQIFNSSFEALYTEQTLSQFHQGWLAFLPVMVDVGYNRKVVLLEADLEDYPGMYLRLNETGMGFEGVYAPYPLETSQGGYSGMNAIPIRRADFIAKTQGRRTFPWRAIAISQDDKELLNNDIIQKLAAPPRLDDLSWIVPGQVSWDWWNDYNLTHVDFKAGMNTPTFKYFIDFAAANHTRYIIIDAGWSDLNDLDQLNPNVDVEEIVNYGKAKDVGVILWASWHAITQRMHEVFPKYAQIGVKGWKIDFIDRDDQVAVASTYEIAKYAAENKFLVDYHGIFKPTGLQRTWPNVIGYEGVFGAENFKWADYDAPRYDVTIPYIRNLAGPMDYTPGAMINATQADFKARNHAPMSKGTRCHQLAEYIVFEAPLQMLSDSPTLYMREQECTDFITRIPTVFDDTVPLIGKVGEFVALARRKGETWYVGVMCNWEPRELTLDFSFLEAGQYEAVVFKDGLNADREATDYDKQIIRIFSGDKVTVHLSNGGGWAARLERS